MLVHPCETFEAPARRPTTGRSEELTGPRHPQVPPGLDLVVARRSLGDTDRRRVHGDLDCCSMMTLVPLRVSVSGPRPLLTRDGPDDLTVAGHRHRVAGHVDITVDHRVTDGEPTGLVLADPLGVAGLHAREGADTVTFVPGAQKSLGACASCRLSSHPQLPSTAGSVVTVASLVWARISLVRTAVSNWMATGMPRPRSCPSS